ncbi:MULTISPECIES: Gfo/Idh/MocA family protein [Streptomyces]|uniref:Gfo/Idh/MocA family oxidoreductase n=1 Tax=Streptomyces tsukubensis (strain DSM 42081 / NBRC 108919 / NRRL 18488 / 9993) TaxID=1114943 RepID=A0A7G3UI34_STRT9|nr:MULTISPECIES: Gfo/Idh/MocA family oxidoreductase [Streptomyces]AZK93758.1 oxidoreductase [Streptomyces tsukubensis]MYS68478.1 Gfo/Idh/MocA family oxidoreductase [Streptomyces sp. SID5473]QKM70103.1 gfo/Idh/MocA family oxidoreductase [Streptomyces tsukubensis NRRL18488]TAI45921.1 Gfo/Idh/MocA family oxidoreductase [Streptomyces tsukubensis]
MTEEEQTSASAPAASPEGASGQGTGAQGRLRVGLVGAGPWAEETQAPALASHDGVVFAGIWARRPEAARALADTWDTTAYDGEEGLGELLAACDAVAFAVPPDVQAPLVVRAARAGCHVLLDKPVATGVREARAAADAVAAAGVASVVFCTLRFAPATRAWTAEQSATGGWFTASARWLGSLYDPASDHRFAASPWRREKGGLWDLGPHVLSVLIPVLGEVTEVTAFRGPEDTVHLALRHASGASSTATLGLSAPPKAAGVHLELLGDQGPATLPRWAGSVSAFHAAVDALVESVRTGRPDDCDIRFGLRLTEILAEAEERLGKR